MAAGSSVQELCEEATCSICLDFFRDPVSIAECGHSFCRACLALSWGKPGAEPSCPQCRGRVQEGNLRPNQQLANFVELAKKFSLQEGREVGANGALCQTHQELLRASRQDDEAPLCMACFISEEHKKAVVAAREGRFCQKHQEPLKLFCRDDKVLICVVCDRSKEHRDHETLPLEEASQEYKDHFHDCLNILKEEREKIVASKEDIEKESQVLLKQIKGEKQETVDQFRRLHRFLKEQEKLLLAQIEDVENGVAILRDLHLARLSEALATLQNHIQEMEETCQQSAGELLQDIQNTLQRYEERETFENHVIFPLVMKWMIWNAYDFNHILKGIMKHLKDTLDSKLCLQKEAKVTLDPNTAQLYLILSEDKKSVRAGEVAQALPNNPERFDQYGAVLGHEGFTAGRHFWEVLVGSEEEWMVGVARKSVKRKGNFCFSPEEGIWTVGKWGSKYKACEKDNTPPLMMSGDLKKIRVSLNYTEGRVAFFDADRAALLYEFSRASFSGETLLPFFWVCLKGHLQLC